jgi:hypothetical protein
MTQGARISVTVVGTLALAVASSVVALLAARRSRPITGTVVAGNLTEARAVREPEIWLLGQRGFVWAREAKQRNRGTKRSKGCVAPSPKRCRASATCEGRDPPWFIPAAVLEPPSLPACGCRAGAVLYRSWSKGNGTCPTQH